MSEFQDIYTKYNKDIYYFLLKITNYNSDLAEELTQETFYQAYISLSKFSGKSDMKTWICAIAKNVCYKYYKKNPRMLSIDDLNLNLKDIVDASKSPDELLEVKEISVYVIKEILKLRKKYRDVLIYRLYFELSFKSIAELMNIKENSAKVIYHRGKETIKENLEGKF